MKSKSTPGWKETEADGEASYTNCLLTTLAKKPPAPVQLVIGHVVPDLRLLAIDPEEIEWAGDLPFQYEALDTAKIIGMIQQLSGWKAPAIPSQRTLKTKLADHGELQDVFFHLTLNEDSSGSTRLEIVRRMAS